MRSSDGSTKEELFVRLLNGIDEQFHLESDQMRVIPIAEDESEEELEKEWEEINGPFSEDGLTVFIKRFGGKR